MVNDDTDFLIKDILDGQRSVQSALVDEIAAVDDNSVRPVERPIGVDNQTYRRRAAKRAYENLLFQRAAEKQIGRMPDEGETIHMVVSAAYRTVDLIPAWLAFKAPQAIEQLFVATLSYSRDNLDTILELHDRGQVKDFALVLSVYFRANEPDLFAYSKEQLHKRGCRLVASQNHCKIIAARFADGTGYVAEGSANLRSHSTTENIALTRDAALFAFHKAWMEQLLSSPDKGPATTAAPKEPRRGYSQRRAGLGVLSVTRDEANRRRIVAWKTAGQEDAAETAAFAGELAALVDQALPVRPAGCVLTLPPQGASAPGTYYARLLATAVAARLDMPVAEIIARTDEKHYHGPAFSLQQACYQLTGDAPAAIVLDDLITSGQTMKLSLAALCAAQVPAWGFAYSGS